MPDGDSGKWVGRGRSGSRNVATDLSHVSVQFVYRRITDACPSVRSPVIQSRSSIPDGSLPLQVPVLHLGCGISVPLFRVVTITASGPFKPHRTCRDVTRRLRSRLWHRRRRTRTGRFRRDAVPVCAASGSAKVGSGSVPGPAVSAGSSQLRWHAEMTILAGIQGVNNPRRRHLAL